MSSWVPTGLTDDHKTKQMGAALELLHAYDRDGDKVLNVLLQVIKPEFLTRLQKLSVSQ